MASRYPRMAVCYDFDGTLSPGNMQEYAFIKLLDMNPNDFWAKVNQKSQELEADNILMYMQLMLDEARHKEVSVTKGAFLRYGREVELFKGVDSWFDRINSYGKNQKVWIDHFIISSGLQEMIEGTSIANRFIKIYSSSFVYDSNDVAVWPGIAVNFTTKTQFLFRINKGALDVWDNNKINEFIPKGERPIPFTRMIYVGDGKNDIPCMKLVKDQGGYSIAVYKPKTPGKKREAARFLQEERVNFIAPADYAEGHQIDKQIKAVIQKVAADYQVECLERESIKQVNKDNKKTLTSS